MNSSIRSLNNKKKITFSKNKKIYPELIPIGTRTINSPILPVIKQPSEPEILVFNYETKLDHVCINHICQNIKIKDDEIGEGYCSSKCAVEHSNTVFQHWLFSEKYPDAIPKPVEIDVDKYENKLTSIITSKIPVNIPQLENRNGVNQSITKSTDVSLLSPSSSIKTQSETIQDDLEITEARQPLFQKLFFETFPNPIIERKSSKSNGVKKSKPVEKSAKSVLIDDDLSDVEIISYVQNPRRPVVKRKRKLLRPNLVARAAGKEAITIVID